jgi:hypothetical protein
MYPIIHPIEPFDSSVGTEIKFTWQGNQIYKVRCIVKNNETGATVYDHTQNTMKQSYVVPPNSGLINGTYYVSYVTVFDINNNESNLQDIGTPFYCLSKPLFNLSVSDGDIIHTSTYKVGVNYSQAQGESLDSYSFTLYTYQKTVISSSGDIYNTLDMSYVISGLENAKQYYLRATGKTLHGITLDTGYILVTVSYTIAQVFNTLELNNKPESGALEIKSNIVSAIGVSEKDVIYIGDEYADLRDNSVTFDEGLQVKGDFTKIFVFYEPERNKSIISFGDGDRLKVDIYYRIGKYSDSNGEKAYFELVANSCGVNYVMNSNYVDVPNSNYQQFALLVNRRGAYYELKVVVISTVVRYSANADGTGMTETKQANSKYVGVGYMPQDVITHENLMLYTNQKNKIPVGKNMKPPGTSYIISEWVDGYKLKVISNRVDDPYYRPIAEWQDISEFGSSLMLSFKYQTSTNRDSRLRYSASPSTITIPLPKNSSGEIKQLLQNTNDIFKKFYISFDPGVSSGSTTSELGEYIIIWDLKLESGSISTPWTPAPSDWVADPTNYTWKPL